LPNSLPSLLYVTSDKVKDLSERLNLNDSCTLVVTTNSGDTVSITQKFDSEASPYTAFVADAKKKRAIQLIVYSEAPVKSFNLTVVDSFAFDASCFTQGFLLKDDLLYYSCGQYGESKITAVQYSKGKTVREKEFDNSIFLEGIALHQEHLFALTWMNKVVFRLDQQLQVLDTLTLPAVIQEGWGAFSDQSHLYISNGTARIYKCNYAENQLSVDRILYIHDNGTPVNQINEMAFVNDSTFAFNRWYDGAIYFCNSKDGSIRAKVDATAYYKHNVNFGVLNGVHIENDNIWFTGKNWPFFYQGKFQ
jgi:glutaminyl-peptide cyclotransferase